MKKLRLAVLGSTRGTDLLPLISAIADKNLHAQIEVIISDRERALILEKARTFDLKAVFLNPKSLDAKSYDAQITGILKSHRIDLIVLIGYMRILSEDFVNHWANKIINVHPSLLPRFAGMMDMNIHTAVLDQKLPETGCTVHWVTKEVDQGAPLIQKKCAVFSDDTPDSLKARVQALEGLALIEAINHIGSLA